jgi:superfamily II DNA/RNA helicase
LDEVDRMLDMGFVDDVERLRAQCPNISQTMLFSATITSEVKNIISKHLGSDYHFIAIEPEKIVVDKIDHAFMMAPHISKPDMLINYGSSHTKIIKSSSLRRQNMLRMISQDYCTKKDTLSDS